MGTPGAEAAVNFVSWPKDVVYVQDRTAPLKKADGLPVWPVKAAAERWDNDNPSDFRYTTGACPAGPSTNPGSRSWCSGMPAASG